MKSRTHALLIAFGLLCSITMAVAVAAAPNSFVIQPGTPQSPFSSMIRPAPTYVDARVLAANVAETQAVPTGARWVLFATTCNFYANPTATATVPADTADGTSSELNPAAWFLGNNSEVTSISVIAGAACTITFSFYR